MWCNTLDRDGYGSFYLRRRNRRAHRVAYYHGRGAIPAGMVIHHTCGNRACVNVQHLKCVTVRENSLNGSRGLGAINAQKTHCPQGHEYDRKYGGQRYCSKCASEKSKRLRRKWRAAPDALAGC